MTIDQYAVKMKDLAPSTPVTLAVKKIRVSGENISTGKGQKGKISLSLLGLKLQKMGEQEPFLSIPLFSVKVASLDLNKKEVVVREMSTRNGAIQIRRSKDGEVNLLSLLPPAKAKGPNPEKKKSPKKEKPWAIKVQGMAIDQYQLRFEDSFPSEPATMLIQDLTLKVKNLTTVRGQRANASLAFRLNEKGNVALDGSVGVNPLAADLRIALKEITISPLQPYFPDQVRLVVTDGSLSTTGTLALHSQEKGGWQVSYKGDGSVNNFASIDKIKAEDFLKWESLSISGMDVGYNPLYVRIDGIALSNFYTRLIIHPDGSLNVQNILGKTNQQQKAPPPSAPQKESSSKKTPSATPAVSIPEIKIARITLQGGEIKFSDNHIQPNYSANLTEVGGRVSGINAAEMRSGDLEMRGMWDKVDPVEIAGKVNPVAQDLFVDLNVRLKDIELSPMTPYAGKYIGYTIQKGKLAMDLKYLIIKKKLEAQNKIFFDQLTFGERVKSPQATKLPVKFAISLLKNRKGEIRVDIPVTGSLDDPKFSVFKIILQVLGNLVAKAATSPFALLGAMVGGGEQLEYAEFEYGSAEVKGETLNKLKTMVKVLQDRPEIRLEVEGHADMEKDREALKTLFFQRKLKTQKLKETAKKGQPAVPVDEIKIETSEYARYLKKAYKGEKFPKPKNFLGFAKNIPVPEMEKLMLTHTEVKEGNLRDLVLQRSRKVKDFLVREGKIEPERIFIVEAKSLAPEKKEKLKDSRVVFKLK
jgi:flagellar motor protein MotB